MIVTPARAGLEDGMNIHGANALLERLGISHRVKPMDRQDEFWLLVIGVLADRILALEAARPTAPATGEGSE